MRKSKIGMRQRPSRRIEEAEPIPVASATAFTMQCYA
jgi:hypothetical protein